MHQGLLLTMFFVFLGTASAQDERFYRQIFTGELPQVAKDYVEVTVPQFNVSGSTYKVDLDSDGVLETLIPQKRDGVDWLEIRDGADRKIFETKILAMGGESTLYKIRLSPISKKVKALILYLDEGKTVGARFESTARIFLVSFENNDLSTMKATMGPHFYHEKEAQREQYFRRDFQVNVYDLDLDGTREVSVEYNHIQKIMKYKGNGEWVRY